LNLRGKFNVGESYSHNKYYNFD